MKGVKKKIGAEECPISSDTNTALVVAVANDGGDEVIKHQSPLEEEEEDIEEDVEEEEEAVTEAAEGDGEVEEDGEEDEDDEENDEEEEGEEHDEQQHRHHHQHYQQGGGGKDRAADDTERPKLDDGFYEIEAVRRKRVRKGQLQYLIKWRNLRIIYCCTVVAREIWNIGFALLRRAKCQAIQAWRLMASRRRHRRGWPETANTWEPLENLQSCSDVIDAFEEGLRSGKHRSSRRRKRKSGASHAQPKKKQQHHSIAAAATDSVRPANLRITDEPTIPSAPINDSSSADNPIIPHQHDGQDVNMVETTEQAVKNGPTNASSDIQVRKECNELDMKINELKGTMSVNEVNTDSFAINFQEAKASTGSEHANGLAKVDCAELVQNTRCTGAKRRKSGSVKRFKQELSLGNPNDSQNEVTRITVASNRRVEPLGAENKFDGSKNAFAITEIIKPISYSTSVTNNFQDVLVTFTARRSDGKEVMVDNKYLKANNPLLLIDFYEQHLRYSPTS